MVAAPKYLLAHGAPQTPGDLASHACIVYSSVQGDDRWRLSGEVIGARLIGDAGASPIVRSRTQSMFSLTLWYRFK